MSARSRQSVGRHELVTLLLPSVQNNEGCCVRLALKFTNTFFQFYYKIPDKVQFEPGGVFHLGVGHRQASIYRATSSSRFDV